jgi:hypothetical protein
MRNGDRLEEDKSLYTYRVDLVNTNINVLHGALSRAGHDGYVTQTPTAGQSGCD